MLIRNLYTVLICFPLCALAQQPLKTNEYIRQNINLITGNDLIVPAALEGLRGKIKKITQQQYGALKDSNGVVMRREFINDHQSFTYFFDKNKKITQSWKYTSTQNIISKKYFRDFQLDLIDSIQNWTPNGKPISFEHWEFDAKNFPVTKKITMLKQTRDLPFSVATDGDKTVIFQGEYRNVYRYHQIVSRTHLPSKKEYTFSYHETGELKTKRESELDHISHVDDYNLQGQLTHSTWFEYNKTGDLIKTTEQTHSFDAQGRLIESLTTLESADSSGIKNHVFYEYEGQNLKFISQKEKGVLKIVSAYAYNKQGDIIEISSEKTKFTFDYTGYDKQGNWTRGVMFRDGDPIYIWERSIEYY